MLTKWNDEVILPLSTVNLIETFAVAGNYKIFVIHYTWFNEELSTVLFDSMNQTILDT